MAKPLRIISVIDIQKIIPNFRTEWLEEHRSDAAALLRNLGVDTDYGIEVQTGLTHRTVLSGVSDCDRIVGIERTDKAWLQSGNASNEARLFTTDMSLVEEIKSLKQGVKEVRVHNTHKED